MTTADAPKVHISWSDERGQTLCGRYVNLVSIADSPENATCKTCDAAFEANFGDGDDD